MRQTKTYITCDRCRATYEECEGPGFRTPDQMKSSIDLCNACTVKFRDWWDAGKAGVRRTEYFPAHFIPKGDRDEL